MELIEDGVLHEHVGIFQDYSLQFLLLLDVRYPKKEIVKVKSSGSTMKSNVSVVESEGALKITNLCEFPVLLHSLTAGQDEQPINAVIGGEESAVIYPKVSLDDAQLSFRTVHEVDMIVPRSRAMIRHRAENFETTTMKETMMDFIFDVGVVFSSDKKLEAQERKLREMLEIDPDDAVAAANLGALLIKKQEYTEAEKWLRLALKDRYALVDNGRRIEMELRELERKNTASAAPRG
jgi:tetratricopeptide (TPR) repeat protein